MNSLGIPDSWRSCVYYVFDVASNGWVHILKTKIALWNSTCFFVNANRFLDKVFLFNVCTDTPDVRLGISSRFLVAAPFNSTAQVFPRLGGKVRSGM